MVYLDWAPLSPNLELDGFAKAVLKRNNLSLQGEAGMIYQVAARYLQSWLFPSGGVVRRIDGL